MIIALKSDSIHNLIADTFMPSPMLSWPLSRKVVPRSPHLSKGHRHRPVHLYSADSSLPPTEKWTRSLSLRPQVWFLKWSPLLFQQLPSAPSYFQIAKHEMWWPTMRITRSRKHVANEREGTDWIEIVTMVRSRRDKEKGIFDRQLENTAVAAENTEIPPENTVFNALAILFCKL